jgi:hypothetical protein
MPGQSSAGQVDVGVIDLDDEHRLARGLATLVSEAVEQDELPLRLLEIRTPDSRSVKLVETPSLDRDQRARICLDGFATLSYCWGGDQVGKLTSKNIASFKVGVQMERFSKSIQDAVWFTAQIGLRYIWIDALCILQDDDNDKAREISKMALYYGTSTVTICAASATSSHHGFLERKREPRYGAGPFRLPFRFGGKAGCVLLFEDPSLEAPSEPLSSRAWTLQESMLSRRILIFASSQLYWTCCNSNASCGGRYSKLTPRNMGFPRSLIPGIFPIECMWTLPIDQQWEGILAAFASRQMTVAGDKLLAISALASHLHKGFMDRHGETVYVAGLFFQLTRPVYMLHALLWFTDGLVAQRASEYRAPSWSWACVDGPVQMLPYYIHFPPVDLRQSYYLVPGAADTMRAETYVLKTEITGYRVELSTPSAAYGAVDGAELKVRGPLTAIAGDDTVLRSITKFVHSMDELEQLPDRTPWWALIPDTQAEQSKLEGSDSPIYCLELVATDSHRSSFGLLLAPVAGAGLNQQNHFRRVGVYVFSCRDYAVPETEIVFRAKEAFFHGAEVADLVLF